MKKILAITIVCLVAFTVPLFAPFEDVVSEESPATNEAAAEPVAEEPAPAAEPAAAVPAAEAAPDIGTLVFTREINGFPYKSASTGGAAISSSLKSAGSAIGDKLKKLNQHYPDRKVKIIGHADASGPELPEADKLGNVAWSKKRAEAVRDYLVSNYGVPASMFEIEAKGSASLKDAANPRSSANRRVVIKFVP